MTTFCSANYNSLHLLHSVFWTLHYFKIFVQYNLLLYVIQVKIHNKKAYKHCKFASVLWKRAILPELNYVSPNQIQRDGSIVVSKREK